MKSMRGNRKHQKAAKRNDRGNARQSRAPTIPYRHAGAPDHPTHPTAPPNHTSALPTTQQAPPTPLHGSNKRTLECFDSNTVKY